MIRVARQGIVTGSVKFGRSTVNAVLRIRLVGAMEVEVDGVAVGLPSGRPKELFVWLAAHPGPHTRSRLAPVFWPDVADATARASLRTALWSLRRAIGPAGDVLRVERDEIELGGADLWVDLREVVRLAETGQLGPAVEMGAADLLPGIVAEWADQLRDEHRRRLARMLADLADAAERSGDWAAAVEFTRRQAQLDRFAEDVHRALLRRMAGSGDRAAAAREHASFRRLLWAELRVVPSPATCQLANQLAAEGDVADDVFAELPLRLRIAERDEFVGRHDDLERLRQAWLRAGEWTAPQVVLISGDPGIGKTRLAARFAAQVQGAGGRVLFGAAAEDALIPAEPFVEALEVGRISTVDELLDVVHRRLASLTATAPVMLVLDDLHWADTIALAVLRRVVRAPYAPRLAIVGTYREADDVESRVATAISDLARDCDLTRVRLEGLSPVETEHLLEACSTEGRLTSEAPRVHERTGGNPFFIRELARFLDQIAPDTLPAGVAIPATVRDLVASRARRLSPDAATVLTAASVLSTAADHQMIQAVLGSRCDPLDALEELVTAGFMVERASGVFAFTHGLVRDAVYSVASRSRRGELHRRAADALRSAHGDEDGPHLYDIALHRCAAVPAGSSKDAVADAQRASAWALDNQSYDQAVIVLTRALQVADDESRALLTVQRAVAFARLTHAFIDPLSV